MGAVNYYTSDYITMGAPDCSAVDFEKDADFMEWAREVIEENGGDLDTLIYDAIRDGYEADEENARGILEKYGFYYFHVTNSPLPRRFSERFTAR